MSVPLTRYLARKEKASCGEKRFVQPWGEKIPKALYSYVAPPSRMEMNETQTNS
jgi:hypothetical protein